LRHADRVEQMAVGGDVDRLGRRERGQHHLHFGRLEDAAVVPHVAVVHLDVGLGEEAEDLRQQMAFRVGELVAPVLDVVGQPHFQAIMWIWCRSRLCTSAGRKMLSDWLWQMKGARSAPCSTSQRWSISNAVLNTAFSWSSRQSRCCTEPWLTVIEVQVSSSFL